MTPTPEHIERAVAVLNSYKNFVGLNGRQSLGIARRILRDHYAALEADGWQMVRWEPIETAPFDGTYVLVCGGTFLLEDSILGPSEHKGVSMACYQPQLGSKDHPWLGDRDTNETHYRHEPTHWMPLPKPPGEGQ